MFTRIVTATVALVASLFVLVGCNYQAADENVRAVLIANCPAVEQNYAVFAAVASSGVVSERTINKVNLVKSQFDALCANPETATVVSVVATASAAYVAIRNGLQEAKSRGADVGYPAQMRQLRGALAKMKQGLNRND